MTKSIVFVTFWYGYQKLWGGIRYNAPPLWKVEGTCTPGIDAHENTRWKLALLLKCVKPAACRLSRCCATSFANWFLLCGEPSDSPWLLERFPTSGIDWPSESALTIDKQPLLERITGQMKSGLRRLRLVFAICRQNLSDPTLFLWSQLEVCVSWVFFLKANSD